MYSTRKCESALFPAFFSQRRQQKNGCMGKRIKNRKPGKERPCRIWDKNLPYHYHQKNPLLCWCIYWITKDQKTDQNKTGIFTKPATSASQKVGREKLKLWKDHYESAMCYRHNLRKNNFLVIFGVMRGGATESIDFCFLRVN